MFRAPSMAGLPSVATMIDDLPYTFTQIARHLGIQESTLKTYKRTGNAPRAILLALFWETRWGRSAADTEAANTAMRLQAQAKALQDNQARMAGIIWQLEVEIDRAGRFGWREANLPFWRWG